ncbi:MAG: flagellar biosynthesis anti-sigma factor FlgM [Pseudomonadales bacterium]|nr:flagellar biosynthesis anti-sigma factor FlgM [Pseudomonadales bacterium]
MVNNINGSSGIQNGTTRSRDKGPDSTSARGVQPGQNSVSAPDSADTVRLSSNARDLQNLETRIRDLPEVNQERVAHIREALREGNYSVDPQRLAAKIAQFELDL